MKCIIIHEKSNYSFEQAKCVQTILTAQNIHFESMQYGELPGFQFYQKIVDANPDFIITIDLAGFILRTDTGDIAFSNLTFPSINYLTRNINNDSLKCLGLKLSIAMFFYCFDNSVYADLCRTYIDIPYIKAIVDYQDGLDDFLTEVFG